MSEEGACSETRLLRVKPGRMRVISVWLTRQSITSEDGLSSAQQGPKALSTCDPNWMFAKVDPNIPMHLLS